MRSDNPGGEDELRLHLLVLRCQAGDEEAFSRLFKWFGSRTLAHLKGLVGEEASDVQQEVWLTVYRSVASLSNPRVFRTWLFRTTRNRAIDFLRRKARERELIEEAYMAPDAAVAGDSCSEPDIQGLDDTALDAALAALPPLQREVLLLYYRDDLSYNEIAMIAGCPIGTVRTRLHHAKRNLQERIKRGMS